MWPILTGALKLMGDTKRGCCVARSSLPPAVGLHVGIQLVRRDRGLVVMDAIQIEQGEFVNFLAVFAPCIAVFDIGFERRRVRSFKAARIGHLLHIAYPADELYQKA